MGNTPLVDLASLAPVPGARVLAKLEMLNPGGSAKDRAALNMLLDKIRRGELRPGVSVVVESSSGNLAIGLAQVCRYFGLRFVCVVDARTTEHNVAILRAYRASIEIVTEKDPETGAYLPARLRRVRELVENTPNAYWPNQYANPLNAQAQEQTMREISTALDGRVDYLFCATSSCGTVRGCSDYVRRHGLPTVVVAVDAAGSQIFGQDRKAGNRLIPGYGSAFRPPLLEQDTVDEVVHVSDLDCVVACRRLMEQEAMLVGGSSGATVAAMAAMRDRIAPGATCVAIFPDGGDRYLDTIYSDSWVAEHFGDVASLWTDPRTALEMV
ncbi:2,3-diaminopropionate biosynthesis protein SbnA [Actinophytocola oryzae]|uniref:2,3-diaminopropionate biosynthesis protein SbnA n=1 Tax=Actinophytocola oryzae TaxID=502181 RepID=UPI001FB9BC96|nr:2,3-diaminopropionate biosynthesis protein SbnA [Actinophytocola oryzae]